MPLVRYITGSQYATSGYSTNEVFQTIVFEQAAIVGGPGVAAGSAQDYLIGNYGKITGTDAAIQIDGSGEVLNLGASASISAYTYGVSIAGAGVVVNSGTIKTNDSASRYGDGIDFASSGSVSNRGPNGFIEGDSGVLAAGTVTVVNTGDIKGIGYGLAGVEGRSSGKVVNSGTITDDAQGASGIYLKGGSVSNAAGGVIYGSNSGIDIRGAAVITNAGVIRGTYEAGLGVLVSGGKAMITNSGTIAAGGFAELAVELKAGGSVFNSASHSLIEGYIAGIYLEASGEISNSGSILATAASGAAIHVTSGSGAIVNMGTIHDTGSNGYGINLQAGGSVDNAGASSLIEGVTAIVGATKVANYGTIESTKGAAGMAVIFGSASDTFVDGAGSTVMGEVLGDGGMLDLAGTAGTLSGLGTVFTDFGRLTVLAGASWAIGASSIAQDIFNDGTIVVSEALEFEGSILGAGTETIGLDGTLKIDSGVNSAQTVTFSGTTGGDLILNDGLFRALLFKGTISGFGGADEIDLSTFKFKGTPATAWSQNGAGGVLTVTDGVKAAQIALFGQYSAAGFTVAADNGTGTAISYAPPPQSMASLPHS